MAGLDQEELLPSFQRLDCCLVKKKGGEQVEVVEVVDLLVVELF